MFSSLPDPRRSACGVAGAIGRGPSRRAGAATVGVVGILGLAVAAVAGAAPASAGDGSSSVTLSANAANANGRTLVLNSLSGTPLSTANGLSASSGSAGFITGVTDANYSNSGYTVQATMTNLYKTTGGSTPTYSCSDSIPSSAVAVVEKGALDLTNISTTVAPLFTVSGTLVGKTVPNTPLTGTTQNLSGTALLGATNGALADIADGTLGALPVKASLGIGSTSSPFTNPAAFNPCSGSGSGTPTANPLLSGTSNKAGVKSVVNNALLAASNPITAQTLINAGWTTTDAVKALVAPLFGGLGALTGLNVGPLGAVVTDLQSITQSGSYQVSPTLSVTVPASASGDYTGVMTVTLADVS